MAVPPVFYDIVRRSAERLPYQPAIEHGEDILTFAELHGLVRQRADDLADAVADRRRPTRAVLVARDDLDTVVDHLALNAAGITVVPVHAGGLRRVHRVVELTGAALLIDHTGTPPSFPEPWRGLDAHTIVRPAASGPLPVSGTDQPPVILFTSGSTGQPKGVPVRADSLSAYFAFAGDTFDMRVGDRCSHTFSLAFDLAMIDLYATWSAGATVVAPSRAEVYNPIGYIIGRRLTHWTSVPSAIDLAHRAAASASAYEALRVSMFAGEELKATQVRSWWDVFPASRVLNLYGPTEATISCTAHEVDRSGVAPASRIPIGTPNPGVEYHILPDEDGSPTRGELCVRGVQRFDGYVDENDNVGKFVDDSGRACHAATPVPPEMFYRTGDIVTVDDGVITYRGRVDNMVKIRGYRVELGELETVARTIPPVREAAAVVVPSPIGDTLGLFVVADAGYDEATVRASLLEALPRYLVPKDIWPVEQLPLNPNGKIDRSVLRQWATRSGHVRTRRAQVQVTGADAG